MKLLLLLLVLGGVAILLISNPQPIALYFFGTNATTALFSLQLPLGIWVILASLAGMMTSLVIIGLNRSPQRSPARSTAPPPQRRNFPEPEPQPVYPPSATSGTDWNAASRREWNPPREDDWNIEEAPVQSTQPQDQRERSFFQREVIRDKEVITDEIQPSPNFEAPQEPTTTTRQGSIYSYTYRELRDSPPEPEPTPPKKQPSESVYDANYRVVTPPYRSTSNSDGEEDDEWV